jgi:hypothetical protein
MMHREMSSDLNKEIFHPNTNEMTPDSQQLIEMPDTPKKTVKSRKDNYIYKLRENIYK